MHYYIKGIFTILCILNKLILKIWLFFFSKITRLLCDREIPGTLNDEMLPPVNNGVVNLNFHSYKLKKLL